MKSVFPPSFVGRALLFLCLLPMVSSAQELPGMLDTLDAPPREEASAPQAPPVPQEPGETDRTLSRSFRNLRLGMSLEDLKAALEGDELFLFRGDRDVSFLPRREENIIETAGRSFVRRAFFQLREGSLFIMAFTLDPRRVDHYSVFTGFVKKYGEPALLDPRQAVWESGGTRVVIERPLTIKYIDTLVFNEIIEGSRVRESREMLERQEFLDDL
jgi:hypothetical protein